MTPFGKKREKRKKKGDLFIFTVTQNTATPQSPAHAQVHVYLTSFVSILTIELVLCMESRETVAKSKSRFMSQCNKEVIPPSLCGTIAEISLA